MNICCLVRLIGFSYVNWLRLIVCTCELLSIYVCGLVVLVMVQDILLVSFIRQNHVMELVLWMKTETVWKSWKKTKKCNVELNSLLKCRSITGNYIYSQACTLIHTCTFYCNKHELLCHSNSTGIDIYEYVVFHFI